MSRYKTYPAYDLSETNLVDELPVGWRTLRGKYVFSEYSERSEAGEEQLLSVSEYYGVKPRGEVINDGDFLSRAESLAGYKKCQKNDLVMNIMLAWKCGLGVSKYDGIVSPAYSVFRFNGNAIPDFMHYLLRTETYTGHFKTRSTGVIDSRLRLYPESFGDVPIILPTTSEQEKIVAFLDYETAKIDTLIEKQQRLIELLKEKRQAVISHAVTKGLNPNAPMKDSGVEWLGEVPAHWQLKRIKHLVTVFEQGWSPQCDARPAEEGEFGVLKVGCVNGGVFNQEENKALPPELEPQTQYTIKNGDLLVSRANTRELVGSAAVVNSDFDKLILCDKLYRLRLHLGVNAELVALYLSIPPIRQQIELGASGASDSMQNISQSVIRDLVVPLPTETEANLLVKEIEKKIGKFTAILKSAATQISYLQERRTALISAAVTGKIDVRDWRPAAV